MKACQKLDSSLLSPSTLASHQVLSISLQIHSKYVSLLPCPLIRSSLSQNYHKGFLNNCPPSVSPCFIHSSSSVTPRLHTSTASHQPHEEVQSPRQTQGSEVFTSTLSCFLSYQNPPFSHYTPATLIFFQFLRLANLLPTSEVTHICLGLYLSDSN